MKEWKEYKMGDVFAYLKSGKGIHANEISPKGKYPVFGGNGLRGYTTRNNFEGDCAIIGRQGAFCGNVRYFKGKAYMTEHAIIAVANENNSTRFLAYLLSIMNLGRFSSQSAQPGLSVTELAKQSIRIPSLSVQKKIANILSSLDDKIELNRRINDNLEQQAQTLFKAWFVDFEPFKDGEFVDDDFGRRPFGWSVKPLEYLVEKIKSGDWGKDEQEGNYTAKTFCMRGADFPDIKEGSKGKMPIRYILEKNFKAKCLCDGNVVVEISGGSPTQSTGRIVLVDKAFIADCDNALICTNFCKSLEIKEGFSVFFFLLWQYLYDKKVMFVYENGSNGLKNLNINSLIERELFVIPPKDVISRFYLAVAPLLSKKQTNGVEVARLTSLRDALIPKLMSGELKTSEIETEK